MSQVLRILLFSALVNCAASTPAFERIQAHSSDLCVKIQLEQTICDTLETENKGDEPARVAKDSCQRAEKLDSERALYLKENNVSGAVELCDEFTLALGKVQGNKVAKQLIEQSNSGSKVTRSPPSSFAGDVSLNDELCVKYHARKRICSVLEKLAAETRGVWAKEFAATSKRPCKRAQEMEKERTTFLNGLGITEPVECSVATKSHGVEQGMLSASDIVMRINNGKFSGKVLNYLFA